LSNTSVNRTSVSVFPNPFNNRIEIHSTTGLTQITLFNTLGQQVIENHKENSMNTSNLPSGVYFLQIENELGARSTHQLIKE
jgi:hypothetical protein